MLTSCKKRYYAVEAVLYIAYNAAFAPISSRDIAQQQQLPSRHLEQIMQKLVHGRVLRGLRGPKGGYFLAKPAEKITLSEICELIGEGDDIEDMPPTTQLGNEVIRPFWEVLRDGVTEQLEQITIAHLCSAAEKKNIRKKTLHEVDSLV